MCICVCIYIYICVYIYIYIYRERERERERDLIDADWVYLRGNHLSNTTCLTQVFFKHDKSCGKL